MVLFFSTQETKLLKGFFSECHFGKRSQLEGREENPSILEGSPWLSLRYLWCWGLLQDRGLEASAILSELRSSFAISHITAQWKLTTNTVLNERPGWLVTIKKWHYHNFKMTVLWQTSHHMLELLAESVDLEYYENICILKCRELYQIILNISFAILMNQSRAYHIICNHHRENGFQCT